jgi:hypothetical protein
MYMMNLRLVPVVIVGLLLAAAISGAWLVIARMPSDAAQAGAPAQTGVNAQPDTHTQPGAPPALPSSLYGYVSGSRVGGVVAATVGEVVVAEVRVIESEGRPFYALNVPADDPATPAVEGGSSGVTVELRIDGRLAGSAPWLPGSNFSLDLPAPAAP